MRTARARPTQQIVKKLMNYEPATGVFTKSGKRRGWNDSHPPYRMIWVTGYGRFYEHQIAHLYMTGEWPADQIDHIDQNGYNNAWSNLRPADALKQSWNRKPAPPDHPTGTRGVWLDPRYGTYAMYFNCGAVKLFRRFKQLQDAITARRAAEQKYWRW